MIRTLIDDGINWTWYLQGDFDEVDQTVTILFYDRWHKDQPLDHPLHENTSMRLVENGKRIVTEVVTEPNWLNKRKVYKVLNPAHVFSYRNMRHYIPKRPRRG